ncbi:MAG TPA: DUF6356 family protein [Steroidobacteraceae bacterium]|nr:DUF6356 family protein [Steroidobacteraceae bacterium]
MSLGRLFTEHPASVGESYIAHLLRAAWFGSRMMLAGGACLVHAIFPFLFVKTGSNAIAELHTAMVTGRRPTAGPTLESRRVPS